MEKIMEPLIIFFSLITFLIATLFAFQVIRLFRKLKQSSNGRIAKNIYVINYDSDTFQNAKNTSPKIEAAKEMDRALKNDTVTHQWGKDRFNDKRKYPRLNFESFVDFVKEGELLKGKSIDRYIYKIKNTGQTQSK